jgi:hypothetical protein
MKLARLLGLHSAHQQAQVQCLLARSAADAEDWPMAAELCLGLVETTTGGDHCAAAEGAGELCAAVARDVPDTAVEPSARQRLLGFALAHCPEETMGDLLRHWRRVEASSRAQALAQQVRSFTPSILLTLT